LLKYFAIPIKPRNETIIPVYVLYPFIKLKEKIINNSTY